MLLIFFITTNTGIVYELQLKVIPEIISSWYCKKSEFSFKKLNERNLPLLFMLLLSALNNFQYLISKKINFAELYCLQMLVKNVIELSFLHVNELELMKAECCTNPNYTSFS